MACSCNHCSSCSSCCNRSYARVSCANRSCSGCSSWNNWNNNWNGWNWGRSGCSSCTSCNHCSTCSGCNSCNHCHNSNHCSGCSSCCENWNCGRSGCGSSRNGFGLLRGVAGPYNCIIDGLRYPFYTGPCGPCACDCCNNCCNHACDDCCDNGCDNICNDCCDTCCTDTCDTCCCVNATFAASTPVELSAGDGVELMCTSENNHDFTVTQDGIRIHRPGSYMVVYTVHVPANEAVSSRFILTLNGDRIAASAVDVASQADGTTSGCTMHATLNVSADSLLKLVSLSPVSICQSPASNVFTLSLHRMEG